MLTAVQQQSKNKRITKLSPIAEEPFISTITGIRPESFLPAFARAWKDAAQQGPFGWYSITLTNMQDINTLIELGFKLIPTGEYLFRGKHQKFTARIVDCNGPEVYVELFKVMPQIDYRPNSDNWGHHYRSRIKDCTSQGSVERAIKKYDLPEDCFSMNGLFLTITVSQ